MQNARLIRGCGWRLACKVSCKYLYLSCLCPSLAQVWATKVEQEEEENMDRLAEMEAFATVVDQDGFTDRA